MKNDDFILDIPTAKDVSKIISTVAPLGVTVKKFFATDKDSIIVRPHIGYHN